MPMDADLKASLREQARLLENVDRAVYDEYGKDPMEPVFGLGGADARIAFFGRDPGRTEIEYGLPFIGAGGQKVRAALYEYLYDQPMPGVEASIEAGRPFFWANTVPYKPVGNKAWSMKTKKAFQPLVASLLLRHWRGRDVITLGREAFLWFGINQPREARTALEDFWKRENRFESSCEVILSANGRQRSLLLHPLPHPSPLNATWFKHFPGLLKKRLRQLEVRTENLEWVEKPVS